MARTEKALKQVLGCTGCTASAMTLRIVFSLLLILQGTTAYAEDSISAGKVAFRLCVQCHQVGPTARNGFAPQLNNIIGRPAAASDYKYSKAMRQSGIVWTKDKLRAFLHDPDKIVPGTKMSFWGIGDEQKITDLLTYLSTFSASPAH